MGNFKFYKNFDKGLHQTAATAWKCHKTQLWGSLSNWKFEHSSRPHPCFTDICTQNRSKCMSGLSRHSMNSMQDTGQNSLPHWKTWIWLPKPFKTNLRYIHPPRHAQAMPNFRKVNLLPAKLGVLFPTHL